VAICPSGMDSSHDLSWNCCGQSLIPIEAASSGVGKVISTTLLLVDDDKERGDRGDSLLWTRFVFEKVRHLLLDGDDVLLH